MNCIEARAQLPCLLYGDLPANEAAVVRDHLAGCASCREQADELGALRRALDALPAPAVQVEVARLYHEAAERQARRMRRWRRGALAVGAVAAGLLIVLGLRLEVRVEAHQLLLRWGAVPAEKERPAPAPAPQLADQAPRSASDLEERVNVLSQVVHVLVDESKQRDAQWRQTAVRLQARLDELQLTGDARWNETRRAVAAMVFPPKQGENP